MRKLFIAALMASAFAAPVLAADLPPIIANGPMPVKALVVPGFTWTGFYLGVNGGYGVQNADQSSSATGGNITGAPISLSSLIPTNLSTAPQGWVFGGHFGYNQQMNWLLLGVEEQIDWAHINNTSSASNGIMNVPLGAATVGQNVNWLSFTNVRIGIIPSQHFLTYVTGGLAVGGVDTTANASALATIPGAAMAGSTSLGQTMVGWDAGLGFEFAMNANWSLRADAKYYDLGTPTGSFSTNAGSTFVTPLTVNFSEPTRGYLGTIGVSYKLN